MSLNYKGPPEYIKEALLFQFIYSIFGLILSVICIIGGISLFIMGIKGNIDWTSSFFGFESKVINAAPGVILFIVGLLLALITKYKK